MNYFADQPSFAPFSAFPQPGAHAFQSIFGGGMTSMDNPLTDRSTDNSGIANPPDADDDMQDVDPEDDDMDDEEDGDMDPDDGEVIRRDDRDEMPDTHVPELNPRSPNEMRI